MHTESHPLAGQTVVLSNAEDPFGYVVTGAQFRVEDYWDKITGSSWMTAAGNPAAMKYAIRTGSTTSYEVPLDDEVVYGKIGPFGHLVHVSEL